MAISQIMQWMVLVSCILVWFSPEFCEATDVYHSSPELLEEWFGSSVDTSTIPNFRRTVLAQAMQVAQSYYVERTSSRNTAANEYPYYAWIPPYVNKLVPGEKSITWKGSCFKTVTAMATLVNDTITVNLTMGEKKIIPCNDFYLFGTVEAFALEDYSEAGDYSFQWDLSKTNEAQRWDVLTKGIRVFRFNSEKLQTIGDLISTIELFVSELTKKVPEFVEEKNVDFLQKYTQMPMPKRSIGKIVINESEIHSGDGLFMTRLDGLDPMLTWATGGTGHSTMLLWMGNELYVVESTVKDSYWPTDGVQKTPYLQWLQQAEEASMNLVYVPLKKELREKFDEAAAAEYFESIEGFDYGYYNFLFGWIDTLKDNYPCVAPDYTTCLEWEHIPVLFGVIEGFAYNVTRQMLGQALNHRVGTQGLSIAEVLKAAHDKGIPANTLPEMVELDSWLYETHRYGEPAVGPSAVCSVFVCQMWKAAGLFKDTIHNDVNCTELVPWDDVSLNIFEKDVSKLPSACQNITKNGQPCQILGNYELPILGYSSRPAHEHMYEHCSSLPPKYAKTDDC